MLNSATRAHDRVVAEPDLRPPVSAGHDPVAPDGAREEDQGRQGDHQLRDDDADVGDRVEREAEPARRSLEPERRHRPDDGRDDRRRDARRSTLFSKYRWISLFVEHVLVPAKAEAVPVGDPTRRVVEAEDDDDDDRQVQEHEDERGMRAQPDLDEGRGAVARRRARPPTGPRGRERDRMAWRAGSDGRSQDAHVTGLPAAVREPQVDRDVDQHDQDQDRGVGRPAGQLRASRKRRTSADPIV